MSVLEKEIIEKPLEYFITKSTDPYISEEQRASYAEKLCEKVNYEVEGAQIATSLLAHKVASPNQDEALYSLKAVDMLVRRCGAKVHTRVGKFRFLNQLVKLLTPKYLGRHTTPEVKHQATVMLYAWRRSMPHIEKFKEVYENLREHGFITEDPDLEEEQVLNVQSVPPKLAVFEDEHKAKLLNQLLNSKNPDDLQAANRMIKSLVRSEDQKMERINKRADELDCARRFCDQIDLAIKVDLPSSSTLKSVFDQLLALRPSLFNHASEAAENGDSILEDILVINDNVNRVIEAYKARYDENFLSTQSVPIEVNRSSNSHQTRVNECIDLLGGECISGSAPSAEAVDLASQLIAPQDDVPFIGFGSRTSTPNIVRRLNGTSLSAVNSKKPIETGLSDFSSLLNDDLFGSPRAPTSTFHPAKPTLNDLSSTANIPLNLSPLDPFMQPLVFESNAMLLSSPVRCLPESVSFDLQQVHLTGKPPVLIMEKMNVRVLLHSSQNSPLGTQGVSSYLITIVNLNSFPLKKAKLAVSTGNMRVSSRLLAPTAVSIPAFSASGPIPCSKQMLLVLPLDIEVNEVEFDFSLSLSHAIDETISGTFAVNL